MLSCSSSAGASAAGAPAPVVPVHCTGRCAGRCAGREAGELPQVQGDGDHRRGLSAVDLARQLAKLVEEPVHDLLLGLHRFAQGLREDRLALRREGNLRLRNLQGDGLRDELGEGRLRDRCLLPGPGSGGLAARAALLRGKGRRLAQGLAGPCSPRTAPGPSAGSRGWAASRPRCGSSRPGPAPPPPPASAPRPARAPRTRAPCPPR